MSEEKDKMPAVVAHSMPAAGKIEASKPVPVPAVPKRKHKLEIQIFDLDYEDADKNNGIPLKRPVRNDLDGGKPVVVEVADKAEFISLKKRYEMCGQTIEVIREINPFNDNPSPSSQPAMQPQPITQQPAMQQPIVQPQPVVQQPVMQQTANPPKKTKPKIVTIGDISVKYDGDKVYQKQWLRLTDNEAKNFRIVNTSTNKIVSMTDKHIEAQRWVMIDDGSQSDDTSADSLVNSIE